MSEIPDPIDDYWRTLPLGRGVDVITRDPNGLLALNKPAGTLSHPNAPRDQPRSLLNAPYESDGEYYEWNTGCGVRNAELQTAESAPPARPPLASGHSAFGTPHSAFKCRLWLLNRLDSATSGVILAATTEELAREIRALFRERHISKTYAALVFGSPSEKTQLWRDRLAVQKRGGQIRAAARAGNIPAEARMSLLRTSRNTPAAAGAPISLIQLEPKTGRSHQLRVQCAKRHLPIIGDATYGDFRANRDFAKRTREKRLFLHSLETRFDYTHAGRAFTFAAKADLPGAFTAHL
ncbi:tRNA pseudouridine65 synthase [Ereboglobus sp. PH5-5]|uniref:RluA family pseudouridine synthase n=1 Tax=Ereboglobus sp. PH5-5 TaxID=2940529 RepID=UPI0024060DF7|nr:RNA pseudouridine synthase [Ereboglobus sp. PH5-5]MDF9833321.1 tRNA pseudouridine65 synthase [Ereboglobus sp. PH5-5]